MSVFLEQWLSPLKPKNFKNILMAKPHTDQNLCGWGIGIFKSTSGDSKARLRSTILDTLLFSVVHEPAILTSHLSLENTESDTHS